MNTQTEWAGAGARYSWSYDAMSSQEMPAVTISLHSLHVSRYLHSYRYTSNISSSLIYPPYSSSIYNIPNYIRWDSFLVMKLIQDRVSWNSNKHKSGKCFSKSYVKTFASCKSQVLVWFQNMSWNQTPLAECICGVTTGHWVYQVRVSGQSLRQPQGHSSENSEEQK